MILSVLMKAFSYLRVSGLGQVDGDGFDRQREMVVKYAVGAGYEIEKEFREEGVSGTKEAVDRPAWNEMMACIRANGVRTILVERSDRLARSVMVGEIILNDCREQGIKVIQADGGIDLTVDGDEDPTRNVIRQILACLAAYDKAIIVQKLRAARLRMRARGERCEGGKPFGEKNGEAQVVARVTGLRNEGKTIAQITEILNAEGHKTRFKAKWHPTSVSRVLKRIGGAK